MMKKHIYDESNELSCTLHGDYYLPDLAVNEENRHMVNTECCGNSS